MITNQAQWTFKSAPEVVPPGQVSPHEAQSWLNFALLMPAWLPMDCKQPFKGSLRKEAPPGRSDADQGRPKWTKANTCSFTIATQGTGRRLRLKQFLYDWAPPAGDHPSLWTHQDQPFEIDAKRIGWLGTDYKGNCAASAILWGTMCETSVLEGVFSDDELTRIYRELHPVDADAQSLIQHTPFTRLCYWARHQCNLVRVPLGLWKHRRLNTSIARSWHDNKTPNPAHSKLMPPGPKGWQLDSYCVMGDSEHPEEIEALYILGGRDRFLWSRAVIKQEHADAAMPPEQDGHPCHTAVRDVAGIEIHHAWIDERYGPHEAVWKHDNRVYMIQSNSAVGFDVDSFLKLLGDMLEC